MMIFTQIATLVLSLSVSHASACSKCDQINKLSREASLIKEVESASSKSKVQNLISQTNKLLGEHRISSTNQEDVEEFKRLVVLVSEVLVHDPLASVSEVLYSELNREDARVRQEELRNAFPLIANMCKRKLLEESLKAFECNSRALSDSELTACAQKHSFNYDSCAKK